MSHSELNFYNAITEILPNNLTIDPQVSILAVLTKKHLKSCEPAKSRRDISRIVCFAIFENNYTNTLMLIEVDDPYHDTEKQQKKDKEINDICENQTSKC